MNGFYEKFSIPFRMVFIMWATYVILYLYNIDLAIFGIYPRYFIGLLGILTMPLTHGSFTHLISNTFPLLFLGMTLFYFFDKIAIRVFFQCYFVTGIAIWIFARQSFHIGASGVIYALAAFLVFFGFFRKDVKSLFISIIIIFLYGSMIYGILPNQPGVSWDSHLIGGIVGTFIAYRFHKIKKIST